MKKLILIPLLLVCFITLTSSSAVNEITPTSISSETDDIEKGGYYYMTLSCRHVRTNDNYSVVTPVRYYSKKTRVSDLRVKFYNSIDTPREDVPTKIECYK